MLPIPSLPVTSRAHAPGDLAYRSRSLLSGPREPTPTSARTPVHGSRIPAPRYPPPREPETRSTRLTEALRAFWRALRAHIRQLTPTQPCVSVRVEEPTRRSPKQ